MTMLDLAVAELGPERLRGYGEMDDVGPPGSAGHSAGDNAAGGSGERVLE